MNLGMKKKTFIGWMLKDLSIEQVKIEKGAYDGRFRFEGVYGNKGSRKDWQEWPPVKVKITIEKIV